MKYDYWYAAQICVALFGMKPRITQNWTRNVWFCCVLPFLLRINGPLFITIFSGMGKCGACAQRNYELAYRTHTHSLPHRQQWFNLHSSAQCLMHAVKAYNFYMPKDSVSFGYFLKVICWLITMLAIVLDLPKQNDESVSINVVELVFLSNFCGPFGPYCCEWGFDTGPAHAQ